MCNVLLGLMVSLLIPYVRLRFMVYMHGLDRNRVLDMVAGKVADIKLPHPVRVGIDGVSASGKTFFADELGDVLRDMGHEVVRVGLDGFHNPSETRHRRGALSIAGYVEDSFNYSAVREFVLDPLGPAGDLRYHPEIYDHTVEQSIASSPIKVSPSAVLILEGVMLFRDEIVDCFDYKILVQTSNEVALERAKSRDLKHFGDIDLLLEKYTKRFMPGQLCYREKCSPELVADAILSNDDWDKPVLKFAP
jgi:uridine kinase